MKKTFLLITLATLAILGTTLNAQKINYPGGRIALTFDGNVHDDDDIIALPISMSLIWAAGLNDKVVFVEYNNHVCVHEIEDDGTAEYKGDDAEHMRQSAQGVIDRFNFKAEQFHDFAVNPEGSTAAFIDAINASSKKNPLWIIAAGPMETLYRALKGSNPKKLKYVSIISHSKWNQDHGDCGEGKSHKWADIAADFSKHGLTMAQSCGYKNGEPCTEEQLKDPSRFPDQNISNGENDFSTAHDKWYWLRDSSNPDFQWLYSRNPFGKKFDPSDCGMVYFLISGGPNNGGCKTCGWPEAKLLLEAASKK